MGQTQCSSEKKESYLKAVFQRKTEDKDSNLDKRLHNEFLKILGLEDYQFEDIEEEKIQLKELSNHIEPKKRLSRFKKWYEMGYSWISKNVFLEKTISELSPLPRNKSRIDSFLTPRNTLSYVKIDNQNSESNDNIQDLLNSGKKESFKSKKNREESKSLSSFNKETSMRSIKINQCEIGLKYFYSQNKNKFKERVLKGPPELFRWVSWLTIVDIQEDRDKELFNSLLKQEIDPKTDMQIKKDLNRTLSENNCFNLESMQTSLYNVLKAYAVSDKEVSYCQGMNFIAGFFLTISNFNEVDTYYLLTALFMFKFGDNNLGFRGFYINDFPLLHLYVYQFDKIFASRMGKLRDHFINLEVPNELWISKWFQTLFTICLPLELLVRVWDCILTKGLDFLFNISLAIVSTFEKELLEFEDVSDISEFFKNLNTTISKSSKISFKIEKLISDALMIKISKSQLMEIQFEYENINKVDLSYLKVKNDMRSFEDFSREVLKSCSDLSREDKISVKSEIINVKRKSSFSNNEASKRSTFDHNEASYHRNNKGTLNEENDDANLSENDDEVHSICSEFDLFENHKIGDKLQNYTLDTKKKGMSSEIDDKAVGGMMRRCESDFNKVKMINPFAKSMKFNKKK